MEVSVNKLDKETYEIKLDSLTIAEILRVYLNNSGVKFAAWRREHPTKPIIFRIESGDKTVKKAVSEAVKLVSKDIDSLISVLKK